VGAHFASTLRIVAAATDLNCDTVAHLVK